MTVKAQIRLELAIRYTRGEIAATHRGLRRPRGADAFDLALGSAMRASLQRLLNAQKQLVEIAQAEGLDVRQMLVGRAE